MNLTSGLECLGALNIDGVPHAIWVLDIRLDPRQTGSRVEIKVAARNPSGRHYIGRFHIERDRLHDEGTARAMATMERVIREGLPPTARDVGF